MSANLPAGVGAPAAGRRAGAHRRIGAKSIARGSAEVADFSAQTTNALMHGRAPQHDVGAERADMRAVEQRLNMGGGGMFAAFAEALGQGDEGGAMRVVTRGDTSVHGFSPVLRSRADPGGTPKDADQANPYSLARSVRTQRVLRLMRSSGRRGRGGVRRSDHFGRRTFR